MKIKASDAAAEAKQGDGSGAGGGEAGPDNGPGLVADSRVATDGPSSNGGAGGNSGTVDSSVGGSDGDASGGSSAGGSSGGGNDGSGGGIAGSGGAGPDAAPAVQPDVPTIDAPGTCSADKDCTSQAPLCLGNRCAKCAGDSDCAGRAGSACAASGLCVACTANKHCIGTAATCDTATNQCVGCITRSDCAGACQTCTGGVCAAVKGKDDPDFCDGTCDATGACKKKNAQSCTAAAECVSRNCADSVCCDTACDGSCEYCSGATPGNGAAKGTCGYISGTPRTGHRPCAGSDACQGTCNGTKAGCTMPGAETSCRQASCNATTGTQTNPASCNSTGICPTVSTTPCSPYICGATACLTNCTSNSQCVSGMVCQGGSCGSCPAGQQICNNACTDTSQDPNHCGNCGHNCSPPHCLSGGCVECILPGDCSGAYFGCDSSTHTCVCRQPSGGNKLQNPGFDKSDGLGSWTAQGGATFSTEDADGCPGSGSLSVQTIGAQVTQCLRLGAGIPYYFGFRCKGVCWCQVSSYSSGACDAGYGIAGGTELDNYGGGSTSWLPLSTSDTTPAGTQGVLVSCTGSMGFGSIDQIYLNTGGGYF